MTTLRPHPAYKPSGVDWLGDIPSHWHAVQLARVANEKKVKNDRLTETTILSLSYGRIIVKDPDNAGGLSPADYATYQIVEPGNIILRLTDLQNDQRSLRVGRAEDRGIITSAYVCLKPQTTIESRYLYRALHDFDVKKMLYGMGAGVRQGLSYAEFRRVQFPLPPLDEQRAIADFLDAFDERVNRFLAARRRMIALLEEQKQAIITQAVTKGLDPDVPMKPSGIEWLGDIPAHWEVAAVARNWKVTDCKHVTVPFVEPGADTYPLASVVQSQWFDLNLEDAKHTTRQWYEFLIDGGRKPRRGDLVFCRNVSVGSAANVTTGVEFALGQDVCLLSTPTQNSRYLNYFFRSDYFSIQLERTLVGSTFRRINVSQIRALIHPLPPEAEQCRIAAFLN